MKKETLQGFNSQRDGILRYLRFNRRKRTGLFQFPTGWNSTHNFFTKKSDEICFNSQRDGILPNTNDYKDIGSHRFNSQRDGILPDIV